MKISLRRTLLATAAAACFSVSAHAAEFINVLTGGTSGVYYPLGVALSQIYAKALPDAKTSVQATKASAENLNLLQAGRGEIGFTLGDALSEAWKGNEEAGFKTPLKKLRTVAAIYPNFIQIVASAESGIKTLADLKGKNVAVGAPKSGTELNARDIFKAAGLSYEDFGKVEYLPFGESVELMKNRQLDATVISAGLGVAAEDDSALVSLNDALERLATTSMRLAQVVECRYFAGYGEGETATALGISERTVRRDWTLARAWLHRELGEDA